MVRDRNLCDFKFLLSFVISRCNASENVLSNGDGARVLSPVVNKIDCCDKWVSEEQ